MAEGSRSWAVVGGGMLGMTLALRLRQAGHRVALLEAAPELGGMAKAWRLGDIVWDRHYHVILYSDTAWRGLLDELGLGAELEWRSTGTGCLVGGELYPMSNALDFLRFPPLRLIDKLRLGLNIFYGSQIRRWRRLEGIPVSDWLIRWSGRRTFERFWKPLLRAKLGDSYRDTSAAFIWATITRLYAARRAGLGEERFGYARGGYARILECFEQQLREAGVEIRTGQPVRSVSGEAGTVRVELSGDDGLEVDRAVITAATPLAARLCPQLDPEERSRLEGVSYLGIVCASMLCERSLSPFYVTNLLDPMPFTGVIEMTALIDASEVGGRHLVYLPRYTTGDDPFCQLPDEDVEEQFLGALEQTYPGFERSEVQAFRVSRVRHVCALPTVGYSESVPPMTTSVPGLFLVNSAQIVNGTLNVNQTVQLAERAAARLRGS